MVARTPPKQPKKMVAPLNPTKLRETLCKVDKCMARLQELQYTVTGGTKVISGVSLSPRSTRGYLRTSLRCKQESLRIKNGNPRKSSPGKFPSNTEEWRRMSLPAMLLGETVGEIIQASQFAREIVAAVGPKTKKFNSVAADPKTPVTHRRTHRPTNLENSDLRQRRNREKQVTTKSNGSDSKSPTLHRARSRINFKISPPPKNREIQKDKENTKYIANRVSPKHKPWAKKTVLFPNPLFHSSPTSNQAKFCRTKSPVIGRNRQTPHKFLIKSPPAKSPAKFQVKIKSPPLLSISPTRQSRKSTGKVFSTAEKIRRSFSPSKLANRLVSPLKRRSVQNSSEGMKMMMSGLKQRQSSVQNAFLRERI